MTPMLMFLLGAIFGAAALLAGQLFRRERTHRSAARAARLRLAADHARALVDATADPARLVVPRRPPRHHRADLRRRVLDTADA